MTKGKGVKRREKFFRNFVFLLFLTFLALNVFKIPVFHSVGLSFSKYFLLGRDVVFSPFTTMLSHFQSKEDLLKENDSLSDEVSTLKIRLLTNEIIERDYKELLLLQEGRDGGGKFAKVLLKPPYSSFDNLIIIGNLEGIDGGDQVFYQNIALGDIFTVNGDIATVKLYSASGHSLTAKLLSGEQIDVMGKGFGRYEATLSKDIEVKKGDPIVLPDKSVIILGVVNEVSQSDDQLFNKILFNIPVDFRDINHVSVEKQE
jgi:cell shape-determining protein MreC